MGGSAVGLELEAETEAEAANDAETELEAANDDEAEVEAANDAETDVEASSDAETEVDADEGYSYADDDYSFADEAYARKFANTVGNGFNVTLGFGTPYGWEGGNRTIGVNGSYNSNSTYGYSFWSKL